MSCQLPSFCLIMSTLGSCTMSIVIFRHVKGIAPTAKPATPLVLKIRTIVCAILSFALVDAVCCATLILSKGKMERDQHVAANTADANTVGCLSQPRSVDRYRKHTSQDPIQMMQPGISRITVMGSPVSIAPEPPCFTTWRTIAIGERAPS